MKKVFYLAAAAMAVLSSCDKDNMLVENGAGSETINAPVFTATIEGPATKTTLADGNKVNWETGDEVFMFFANESSSAQAADVYEATPGDDASTATLTWKSDISQDNPTADRLMYAVYPASLFNVYQLEFPATQVYGGDDNIGFAPMAFMNYTIVDHLPVINPTPDNLTFKNVAALLKITVPYSQMESVQSITVSSDQAMHGVIGFEIESGGPELSIEDVYSPENSYVTLDCAAGNEGSNVAIPADGSKTFYISIPVNTYGYLQINVTDGTTTKSMRTNKAGGIRIERNKIYPINFAENYSPAPAYEYVDLGLSVKWATFNVGASRPEEYGDYFAWGETEPYYEAGYAQEDPQQHWKNGKENGYNKSTYKYCYGTEKTMFKYCDNIQYGYNSFTDNKRVLDLEDDAANVNWGGSWRMPTKDEQDELRNECIWIEYAEGNIEFNGVAGYKIQSKTSNNWIFLPAAGRRFGTSLYYKGSQGFYWSSSLVSGLPWCSYDFAFGSSNSVVSDYYSRFDGQPIRPVCP